MLRYKDISETELCAERGPHCPSFSEMLLRGTDDGIDLQRCHFDADSQGSRAHLPTLPMNEHR